MLNDFTSDYEPRSNLSSLSISRDLAVLQGRYGSFCPIVSFFWGTRHPLLEWNSAYMESDYLWSHTNISFFTGGVSCPFVRYMKSADPLQYLRIRFQQYQLLTPSRISIILCCFFALSSTIGMIAVTLGGTFYLSSVHLGSLFILVGDYVGVTLWYWWLAGQMTEGRVKVRRVSYYLSAMVFFLLMIAIIGTAWKAWIITLEVC